VRILRAWTDDALTCQNGVVADFSLVLSGCTRGNAVPLQLGAGQGSKGASLYQIKYMGKDCVEISASASVLLDAYEHVKNYPSAAPDTGTLDHSAVHFCQRVINNAAMELEGVQAANQYRLRLTFLRFVGLYSLRVGYTEGCPSRIGWQL
jgi:hypothetical protein